MGDRGQPGFRVAHRRGWVVVHGAEVAVTIEERMAAGEGLHQPHQGVVDRLVAMGVVLAEHIPHHPGAFAVGAIWGEPQLVHREQDAALHGFESIPHIRQGPTHDHAHGVFEVGALHLLVQGDRFDPPFARLLAGCFGAVLGHPVLGSGAEDGAQPTDRAGVAWRDR